MDVAKDDIRDFIAQQGRPRLIVDGLGRKHRSGSPATALVRFKSLQQFFRHCVEEGELEVSPMSGMRPPKTDEVPVPIIGDEVLTALLKARSGKSFVDRRDAAILRVFLDTGCRLAEVTNLRFADTDLVADNPGRRQGQEDPQLGVRPEDGTGHRPVFAHHGT